MNGTIGGSKLGLDPDYASLLGGLNRDPRLLMAQKLMDVEKLPTNNSTQSSFWANLLNQGARGALGGYLYNEVKADREKEARAQEAEAAKFRTLIEAGPPGSAPVKDGSGGTAPAQPSSAPGPRASIGGGALPPEQQQAIVTSATNGTMVPPPLLHALITQESGWKPNAQGKGSDFGLGQVTASTAANPGYGLPPLSDADRADPYKNAAWSARYLEARGKAAGLTRPEDWSDPAKLALALKAYNGGGDPNYVQNVTRHMQGRQADATPAPGSNLDALLRGVDQPKPRGIQLAENLLPGGTATDSPTPILPAPRAPVVSAALQGAGPQPPSATVPQPDSAASPQPDAAVAPPIAAAVPPRADVPDVAAPTPAVVPQPEPALVPDNPLGRADPASLANFNGLPQPEPAGVPPPEPAVVPTPPEPAPDPAMIAPAGSGETGGQPTVLPQEEPPLPVPPIPPALLARRLQQAAPAQPAGGGDATEALNTASLAAARRGEAFVPGAAPPGPQLAAPLMSWAGNLTDAGAPLLTPAGSPTGQQLAAPLLPPGAPGAASQQGGPVPLVHQPLHELVTPASGPGDATGAPGATTDTSAAGGQSKGAAPSAPAPSTADAQARADWYLTMARQAAGSSNPKIRAQAGVLEAQGQALQRRLDRQDLLDQRATERRDAREAAAANRNFPIHEMQGADGKVHSVQIMPDGSQRDLGLAGNQHEPAAVHTVKLLGADGKEHMFILKPDGSQRDLGPTKGEGGADFGNSEEGKARALYISLYPKMADGSAKPEERATFEASRNRLQQIKTIPDGQGGFVRVTPDLPDLAPVWGALPQPAPPDPGQKADMGQNVAPGTRQYGPPGGRQQPPGEVDKMLAGVNSIRNTGNAMRALRENPSAVGPLTQIFPKLQQWFDPKGVATQAAVDDIGSELRHARSGGAVTESEFRFLHNFVPEAGDPYEVAIQKVQRLHREYGNILQDRYNTYGPNGRYAEIPSVRDAIEEFRFPAVPNGRDNAQTEKMLDNGAAYTLPARLGGGRAKWNAATRHFDRIQEGQ